VWSYLGAIIACVGFLYMIFIIARTLFFGIDLPGYASLFSAVLFIGGVQLVGIGIVGEYLGRIYLEVKSRPNYIVRAQYQQDRAEAPPMSSSPNS
jgi:glycosyltransferase involved in cell wall biosynthesis